MSTGKAADMAMITMQVREIAYKHEMSVVELNRDMIIAHVIKDCKGNKEAFFRFVEILSSQMKDLYTRAASSYEQTEEFFRKQKAKNKEGDE